MAARRTKKILDQLDILANCSNKSNYEYTDDDVRKMFTAIENKTRSVKAAFGNAINKNEKNTFEF